MTDGVVPSAERTWEQHVALAEHYVRAHETEKYLYTFGADDKPWHLVRSVEAIDNPKLKVTVAGKDVFVKAYVQFTALHEPSGLTLIWMMALYEPATGRWQADLFLDLQRRLCESPYEAEVRAALADAFKTMVRTVNALANEQASAAHQVQVSLVQSFSALRELGLDT
jgi:hypothetical protein